MMNTFQLKNQKILITGTAGFIGHHLISHLAKTENTSIGLDVINDYYDTNLKYSRLEAQGFQRTKIAYNQLVTNENISFIQLGLEDRTNIERLFEEKQFDIVIHLAAQAGVRYSLTNPYAYVDSNLVGFVNIMETARKYDVKTFIYASSSSVYGANTEVPYYENSNTEQPISLYAASKKANELMAYSYAHLFKMNTIGLRFFTVFGAWGRPDMAISLFTKSILEDKPIKVFNHGNMQRDFTYIDDVVEGICLTINRYHQENLFKNSLAKVFNIGNHTPIKLMELIETIEEKLGKKAIKDFQPLQMGDMLITYAAIDELQQEVGYIPKTDLKTGIGHFIDWFKTYYQYSK